MQENVAHDPWADTSMITAGETVARERGIGRQELDDVVAPRYSRYEQALADDRAFQREYMGRGRRTVTVTEDAGIRPVERD